ncbi:trichohyalin isoform X2 [Eurosta solidaginis]|uniref:trichohyalin isoform X2 n=1 Tax=Eurosta solidaginis TaxID=178769 RepID=UPI00353108D5
MGDSMLPEICDLVFSVLLGYAGALEFLYVIRHLYHWSCNHMAAAATQNDAGSLRHLQDRIRSDLAAAEDKERQTGMQTMKDGVLYRDGFRIDPKQLEQDRLKAEQSTPEGREKRKQEIEAELKRQLEIEEQTRQQLAEAEAKLEQQHKQQAAEKKARKAEEEEQARILLERERQREEEERKRDTEGAEAARKAAVEEELKRQRQEETEKRRKEEAEEQRRHEAELIEAAKEVDEQTQKLLEAERQREQEQQKQQIEEQEYEEERKFLEAERLHEAEQREREIREAGGESNDEQETEDEEEKLQRLKINAALTSGKLPVMSEAETLNNIMQLLNTESKRRQNEIEYELSVGREREERQKLIEENARKFLEADHDMEELLETVQKQRHYSGTESAPQSPVHEEPCLRKTVSPLSDNSPNSGSSERLTKTVKTQFGQKTQNESFSVSTKPLLFKSISDDTPSFEPQSSLSPQPSTEEYVSSADNKIDTQFAQLERQEPDGEDEDNPSASAQYTEDYLRSLDGIKQRPLVREDGSGRRRAFKKRRSSGSSNSSFDSRASRDEELKMFTSLEEEELQPKKEGETDDFTPIKYTSEQLLKVKMPRRRHKRSPAKDVKPADSAIRGSLEMLNEEANTNPWGEVTPEHYKDMPFWKKEKSMSIDEEAIELDIPATKKEIKKDVDVRIVPKSSTFEEATHTQNKEAITALQRQQTKEEQEQSQQEKQSDEATNSDIQSNLIFSGEYTKAMDKDWHSGHFCCWQCDESLTGQRYVIRDDHPYCIKCYENVFANTCEECNKIIGIDSKDLSYKDKHWHEACFLCHKCHLSLVDKQFGAKADKIYCGTCYDAQFASRCDGCGEVFRAGTKKMEYKTRQWHENCFCCCICKMAIGTKSFIPREQEIYCAGCYEEKFATRCIKCNKVITSGGVTYKNEPWHRECFTCTHCNITLAGQRFTSRDEKPYCAECFGELFAKRCTACEKPITGIGGTRFISFEDRHWHHDCFVCASCKTSLVGRGFITDGPDIICPECAKQRLM